MTQPHAPITLRAKSGADFLAALPRLTGMRAPNSAFVVFFGTVLTSADARSAGKGAARTLGSARIDLPTDEQLRDLSAATHWAVQVVDIARQVPSADGVVIVIDTEHDLTARPASSEAGFMAMLLSSAAEAAGLHLRDLLAQGPDGWAGLLDGRKAALRPLSEIGRSSLHDPGAELLGIDEWRAAHPGQTSDDPDAVRMLAERATVAVQRRVVV